MKVIYRPHRGSLIDSLAEAKIFDNVDQMKSHIIEEYAHFGEIYTPDDIIIGEPNGNDDRIGWTDCRYVCVPRMQGRVFDVPQCIGMCSLNYTEWRPKKNFLMNAPLFSTHEKKAFNQSTSNTEEER